MSGRLEGIGATLQEDRDYIKVVEIIPEDLLGGRALKAGDLF